LTNKTRAKESHEANRQVFNLTPVDNHRQANLCGPMDDNLKSIERRLGVEISYRGHEFTVVGKPSNCLAVVKILTFIP
jgi:phosphate starvation-inducible PhoH-like protein